MYKYEQLNKRLGWIIWLISTLVYLFTLAPSVSYWDCGEFISAAYKLEVGHPPGAPLYILIARFFSLFSFGNTEIVAFLVNSVSAFASSFTILFLFWTTTYLAKKLVRAHINTSEKTQNILILSVGAIASLSFAFSDTFWFSAVEGEVYALSSLCTAFVFWAIFKWEENSSTKHSNKWLLLIAYIMGLSVGVHLLNILTLPALVLVYYFKKHTPTYKGIVFSLLVSLALVAAFMWIFIPGVPALGAMFDYLFVNQFGFAPNSGMLFFVFFLFLLIGIAIFYSHKAKKKTLNSVLLIVTVLLIGYSSYALIVIRSTANPPMDENNPENPYSLISYLNREQYGSNPLLFGQTYNAPIIGYSSEKEIVNIVNEKYTVTTTVQKPVFNEDFVGFFPRMWSNQPQHVREYKRWANVKDGENTHTVYAYGQTFHKPTFAQNLTYFFKYQVEHMYMRYLLWNFVGKQNDSQGNGEPHKGNWISGIGFLDSLRLGAQDALPEYLQNNPARNRYFGIPFILALLGLVFLWQKSKKTFLTTFVLFFSTGIAIVIYLNQYPLQARERDYAYVGSFYVFAIWIGFGLLYLYELLSRYFKKHVLPASLCLCFLSPVILFAQNLNDHNRSGRFVARDFSKNYLESCQKNALLFTYGDNDTFPLWYLQEVEGVRTDVRVINLNLLNTDWYINQMMLKAYDSEAVPHTLGEEKYRAGVNDQIFAVVTSKLVNVAYPAKDIINIIASKNPDYKAKRSDGTYIDYIPTPQTFLQADSANLIKNGIVTKADSSRILKNISFSVVPVDERGYILDSIIPKSKLMMLDILATNDWQRPIYFATSVGSENYFNFNQHLFLEGLANKLQPLAPLQNTKQGSSVNTEIMYENLMQNFAWGNVQKESVYIDENIRNQCMNYRNLFGQLADALITERQYSKAKQVLDKCLALFPDERIPFNYFSIPLGNAYYELGDSVVGQEIHNKVMANIGQNYLYYMSVKKKDYDFIIPEAMQNIGVATDLFQISQVLNKQNDAYIIAEQTSAVIEHLFPFTKQITLTNPAEFEERNSWTYKLSRNNQYVAYWYNILKQYAQN